MAKQAMNGDAAMPIIAHMERKKRIALISTGGTIEKTYDELKGASTTAPACSMSCSPRCNWMGQKSCASH